MSDILQIAAADLHLTVNISSLKHEHEFGTDAREVSVAEVVLLTRQTQPPTNKWQSDL
jgi:hypothetical protein